MLGFQLEGLGWYTYEIVKHWLTHNQDVKWTLLFDRRNDVFAEFDVQRIVIGPKTSHTPSIAYWNERPLTSWLNKNHVDVYFSPDGFIPLRTAVPCVPVVHDLAPLVFPQYMRWRDYVYYRLFQLRMIRRAALVLTVSNFSKNEIVKLSGIKSNLVAVAYNGLHSGFTSPNNDEANIKDVKEDSPYFIYYGSIHPRKNVFGLIKSFELYREKGGLASLVLAGRSAWKVEEVEKTIKQSNASEYIKWLPYLDSHELQMTLRMSIGLVYISHYEGFGLPVLEAMASGVPVITSSHSSMSEVGGDAVLTCDPLDHAAVAQQMKRLSKDHILRSKLIRLGLERAKEFNYYQSSQNILKLLKKLTHED
jgi:glycosyltransferase involved in cell wall biosynthesis